MVIIVPSLLLQAEVRQAVCAMYKQPIEQTEVKEEREGRLRHKYYFLLTSSSKKQWLMWKEPEQKCDFSIICFNSAYVVRSIMAWIFGSWLSLNMKRRKTGIIIMVHNHKAEQEMIPNIQPVCHKTISVFLFSFLWWSSDKRDTEQSRRWCQTSNHLLQMDQSVSLLASKQYIYMHTCTVL